MILIEIWHMEGLGTMNGRRSARRTGKSSASMTRSRSWAEQRGQALNLQLTTKVKYYHVKGNCVALASWTGPFCCGEAHVHKHTVHGQLTCRMGHLFFPAFAPLPTSTVNALLGTQFHRLRLSAFRNYRVALPRARQPASRAAAARQAHHHKAGEGCGSRSAPQPRAVPAS
jgi:hypothetical protein